MRIRPCAPADLPAVAALLTEDAPGAPARSAEALSAYLREAYFEHPWFDPEIAPLLAEDERGRLDGFLGVGARPMRQDARLLRVAVTSNFKVRVDAAGRRNPLTAIALLRRLFAGPQDMALTNGANRLSKRLWTSLGGEVAPLYSLDWVRPLRPARGLLELALGRRAGPRTSLALRWSGNVLDVVARPLAGRLLGEAAAGAIRLEPYHSATVLQAMGSSAPASLAAVYDEPTFDWLWRMTAHKAHDRRIERAQVHDVQDRLLGWFAWIAKAPRVGEVLHLGCAFGDPEVVFSALLAHADRHGIALLRGEAESGYYEAYRETLCLLNTGRWTLVHARRAELLEPFRRGTARLAPVDGERWMIDLGYGAG